MSRTRFWHRSRNYRREMLLQQLEERIVLDAAVTAAQDNPNDQPGSQADAPATDQAATGAAPDAGGAASGDAGLTPELPDNFDQVLGQDLNVVLVANNLADVQAISDAAAPDAKVILFDAQHDSLATVATMLQDVVSLTGKKIDNLAVVGHGTLDNLTIGADQINFFTLADYAATFEALGQSLTESAQIQFYGCYLAGDALGQALVNSIAMYTTADTFASTDATGGANQDWTLEYSSNAGVAMETILDSTALASVTTELANPYMVEEITTSTGSEATGFYELNGKVYYQATDGVHVRAMWVYDTVAQTNTLLMEAPYIGYNATVLTSIGDNVYFKATTAANGTELWVTQGTVASTHIVKDITAGTGSGLGSSFAVFNGELFFTASNNASSNYELWKTNGTDAGTTLVKEINATASSNPAYLTVMGTELFFKANDGIHGYELWKTNGTEAGTVLVCDIDSNQAQYEMYSAKNLTVMGNYLYFTTGTGTNVSQINTELWRTDGVVEAVPGTHTTMVADLNPGTASSNPGNLTVLGDKLVFTATTATTGTEVFAYDSVSDSAYLLKDIKPGTGASSPSMLTVLGNKVIFKATDYVNTSSLYGEELWSTDGTAAGTKIVKDICAGFQSSYATNLTVFDDGVHPARVFFQALNGTSLNGQELWSITASGGPDDPLTANVDESWTTVLTADINPGTAGSTPANFAAMGGNLYFTANDGTGSKIWKATITADPDLAGTTTLDESVTVGAAVNVSPGGLKAVGNNLIFTANDGLTGLEPWISDGTQGGSHLIQDINLNPGTGSWLTNVNGTLYFVASDTLHGQELWKSDGTAAGTMMVMDLNPGTYNGVTSYGTGSPLANVNGTLFFLGSTSTGTDGALYKLDATGMPTLVKNVVAGTEWLINFTPVGNTLYFVNYSAGGYYLWKSDGTDAGTVAVTDALGAQIRGSSNLTNVDGTLFFQAGNNTTTGAELYKVDPATGQGVMIQDLAPGNYTSSTPSNLTNVNGTLYFTATVGGTQGLYKSDGSTITQITNSLGITTMANLTNNGGTLFFTGTATGYGAEMFWVDGTGTIQVIDTITGATGGSPTNLFNSNGTLYFSATDSTNGKEVWTYTGGVASILKDINPGTGTSFFTSSSFVNFDGLTYFKATNGTSGDELWQTDGTGANTQMVSDIAVGTGSSNPSNMTVSNNLLYFTATNMISGSELWAMAATGANDAPVANDVAVVTNEGVAVNIALSGTDPEGQQLTVQVLTAPQHGTLSGSGFSVLYTPNAGYIGPDFFTYTVTDNGTPPLQDATPATVSINVAGVNDPPVNSVPLVAQTTDEDIALAFNALAGNGISVSDPDAAQGTGELQVTLTAANGTVTLDLTGLTIDSGASGTGTVTFTGLAGALNTALDTLSFTPNANYNGPASLTISTSDLGNFPGPALVDTDVIDITVNAVNDAPVNTVPASVTATVDTLTPIIGLSIADADAGSSTVQVTLSVTHGTLQVSSTVAGGLTVAQIVGNGNSSVVLIGTLAQIDATLADATGLQYQSALNYTGADTLTVSSNDLGATGSGGAGTTITAVPMTVTPWLQFESTSWSTDYWRHANVTGGYDILFAYNTSTGQYYQYEGNSTSTYGDDSNFWRAIGDAGVVPAGALLDGNVHALKADGSLTFQYDSVQHREYYTSNLLGQFYYDFDHTTGDGVWYQKVGAGVTDWAQAGETEQVWFQYGPDPNAWNLGNGFQYAYSTDYSTSYWRHADGLGGYDVMFAYGHGAGQWYQNEGTTASPYGAQWYALGAAGANYGLLDGNAHQLDAGLSYSYDGMQHRANVTSTLLGQFYYDYDHAAGDGLWYQKVGAGATDWAQAGETEQVWFQYGATPNNFNLGDGFAYEYSPDYGTSYWRHPDGLGGYDVMFAYGHGLGQWYQQEGTTASPFGTQWYALGAAGALGTNYGLLDGNAHQVAAGLTFSFDGMQHRAYVTSDLLGQFYYDYDHAVGDGLWYQYQSGSATWLSATETEQVWFQYGPDPNHWTLGSGFEYEYSTYYSTSYWRDPIGGPTYNHLYAYNAGAGQWYEQTTPTTSPYGDSNWFTIASRPAAIG